MASAPAIFQKLMDIVLQGIPGVACYIDDILVSIADEESHLSILEEVFNRLAKHSFRMKLEKCEFLQPCIQCLDHIVSKDGIKPVQSKIEVIVNGPTPENVQQLKIIIQVYILQSRRKGSGHSVHGRYTFLQYLFE